jgi:hypothetical protein
MYGPSQGIGLLDIYRMILPHGPMTRNRWLVQTQSDSGFRVFGVLADVASLGTVEALLD